MIHRVYPQWFYYDRGTPKMTIWPQPPSYRFGFSLGRFICLLRWVLPWPEDK